MRSVFASVMLLLLWATPAAADLYRWVDPETGSVKFSSYPPPWHGDAAKQRRAPKVEVIPAGTAGPETPQAPDAVLRPATRVPSAGVPEELGARRKAMLQEMSALAAQGGADRAQALARQAEAFTGLSDQIDKLDPQGAAARRGETQALIEKITKGTPR